MLNSITVSDTGSGMPAEELQDIFLVIGTTHSCYGFLRRRRARGGHAVVKWRRPRVWRGPSPLP
jgi:hypothetical protein